MERKNNKQFTVTPWSVEGTVNYERLIEKFGTQEITPELKKRFVNDAGEDHMYLRRNFFFSHRDLDKILDDYEDDDGFFLYTGVGPSGEMHIGHIIPFYFTKWIQERFDVNVYIQVTDDEKYWANEMDFDEIDHYAERNIKNIAAVGFDPDKTFIFRNREYVKNMYDGLIKIANKINNSVASAVFGFGSSTNIGMNFFPAIQMLPTFLEKKRCLIPAAIDQDPYWRVQRDIAESFGYPKTAAIHSKFVPALTGPEGKMSSSKPKTAIMLDDTREEVRKKVMKHAYSGGQNTKAEHREKGADLSVDVSYQWLHNLFMEDDERLQEIGRKYNNGEMLTGEIKQILVDEITDFLEDHQKRKEKSGNLAEKMMYDGKLAEEMWQKKTDLS